MSDRMLTILEQNAEAMAELVAAAEAAKEALGEGCWCGEEGTWVNDGKCAPCLLKDALARLRESE